ncbi:MAG: DUF4126 domain-containing protein [Pseudomonadota bacterium]
MGEYQDLISVIALSMGAAWASGINLYAAILVLGVMGMNGDIVLPPDLQVLASPIVIAAAGLMYMVEFTADKIPGVDSSWDALHTLVRVPAGAMLAAGAVGDMNPAIVIASGILGGGVSLATHAAKSGTRVLINTSPEPVTNWTASIMEDIAVFTGVWTALTHPGLFIVFFVVFILLLIWSLPKLWTGIKKVFSFIFGRRTEAPEVPDSIDLTSPSDPENPSPIIKIKSGSK